MEKQEFDIRALVAYLERESGLDEETVVSAVESALKTAAKKNKNLTADFRLVVDRKDMKVRAYDTIVVSNDRNDSGFMTPSRAFKLTGKRLQEGDVTEVEIPIPSLGRIVAGVARQMLMQKLKEARRNHAAAACSNRVGEIVSGNVSGFSKGDIIVRCNGCDMVLPRKGQIRKEKLRIGDSVRAIIESTVGKSKVSPVVLSRTSNRFLEELIRESVPEVNSGDIEIVSVSREPGFRAKVSVRTKNDDIDPVGTCIGRRGCRIRSVSRELSGEMVDVVRHSNDIRSFIASALLPGKIDIVEILLSKPNDAFVTVSSEEYPKTIGRNGINIKMASELTGMHITVEKTLESMTFEEQKERAVRRMQDLFSISEAKARSVVNAGYLTAEGIATDDEPHFRDATGLDEVSASGIHSAAVAIVGMVDF